MESKLRNNGVLIIDESSRVNEASDEFISKTHAGNYRAPAMRFLKNIAFGIHINL